MYTGEENELQVGEPLVSELGQTVCLENECAYVFLTRKSKGRFRRINRWGRKLISSRKQGRVTNYDRKVRKRFWCG